MAIAIEKRRALDPTTGRQRPAPAPVVAWRVRWDTPTGKRSETFHTERAAKDFRATLHADQLRGTYVDPHAGKITVREYAEIWYDTHHVGDTTRRKIRSHLDAQILPALGDLTLTACTLPAVKTWVAQLTKQLAPGTVAVVFGTLRSMMNAAVDEERLPRSPCAKVRLPPDPRQEKRFLTVAEVDRLARAIDERYRAMVLLAAYSGLRWGEISGLQRKNLDLLRRRVTVRDVLIKGKSGMELRAYPKTDASVRTIRLPRAVCDELARHLEVYGTDSPYVFLGPRGRPVSHTMFNRRDKRSGVVVLGPWPRALADAGLVEPLPRFHDLRHTHAAFLIAQNGSMKAVQRRMGHSSITTTFDTYGHLFEEDEEAIVTGLEAAMDKVIAEHQALPEEHAG